VEQLGEVLDNINRTAVKAPEAMELVKDNLRTYKQVGLSVQSRLDKVNAILDEIQASSKDLKIILGNIKQGSADVPKITTTFKAGIEEIRIGVEEIDRVVTSMQRSALIRGNLPPDRDLEETDALARP
jgi:phospholipid/cholesterol/gamma-HCH transport system substrate-binding protein